MDAQVLFSDIQQLLKLQLTDVTYNGWFTNMRAVEIRHTPTGDVLILASPNPLAPRIVPEKYTENIQNCLEMLGFPGYTFEIILEDPQAETKQTNSVNILELKEKSFLNPKYTFESFVEGTHNRMAYHSCLSVADFPGTTYNPLFIWGDSGLGKTHLLHAIGNHVLDHHPEKNVLYVPSETFMNDLINSISSGKGDAFRERYRKIDVLLIDDVQFLSKREATQDEFFHTFNTLYNNNKQIVICSDRPPENIEHLAERIRSRFKWGLTVDIQVPDYETRIAILKKKISHSNVNIDMDVLSYIADHVNSNVRDLEGALNTIQAYSSLLSPNTKISIDIASSALKDFSGNEVHRTISCQRIIETVCEYYNISVEDIRSRKRPQSIVYPRQVAMYLCRKLTDVSLDLIGTALGGRDHTTIMYGCECIAADLSDYHKEDTIRAIGDIEHQLTGE